MLLEILKDEIEASWNAAASEWDAKALTRLYTENALFFGLLPKLYVGRPEIETYFLNYKHTLRRVTLDLVDQELRPLSGDAFAAQGFGNLLNYSLDGELLPNRVRTSLVIVKVASEWQISLHHFSHIPQNAFLRQTDPDATEHYLAT